MLFFATLLADIYIYRSVVRPRFKRLSGRVAYIVFAILSDGMALSTLLIYSFSVFRASSGVLVAMWLVWLFFLTALPKLLYAVGGVTDRLAGLAMRRRSIVFRAISVVLSLLLVAAMVHGATAGRTRLRTVEVEVRSPRIPASFDGYRIVQISDLHTGTMCEPVKRISQIADRVAGLAPDMVVNTGDVVNISYLELTPEIVKALSAITAPDGVWSVWGNHDLGFYIKDTLAVPLAENRARLGGMVAGTGCRILSDESVHIRRGEDEILLTGLDYPRDPMLNSHNSTMAGVDIASAFAGTDGDTYNIVLAHTPKLWGEIVDAGRGDLTLSGHVHAMQMKLRLFGREWSPARYLYEQWSGKYVLSDEKNSVLYVNDGIGCVGYPMRIGAPAEVTLFILRRCE